MTDLAEKHDAFAAISVAVLLIGAASGSAMTMLVLSTLTLALGVLLFRPSMGAGSMRVVIVAALTAIMTAIAMVFVRR